ncbi:hypothetical protein [Flavobacterium subsaxonicum]|uniref:Uncharacterized protein n=1 Tax=Flavobacterium subsaxonicum WB 4.1-42 = DSM 21790 TaxID=1121898 RepID=A0A0A2MG46_9FLAO|nr:hypothetical protein [Flavobacterium subsaxonicum]KGO91229.1 hypothetical protein Q766_18915 [Flavobacterium subsaxonicum WB 4.1-42 = DSM 21790]
MIRLIPFALLINFITCFAQQPQFNVTADTVHVNLKGNLSAAFLTDNKYYALFETDSTVSTAPYKQFYIISKKGVVEKDIALPKVLDSYGYKIYFKNDSIILNNVIFKKAFYFDRQKLTFEPIKPTENFIYEDANYCVTYTYSGEWGGTTYFKHKISGKNYEVSSSRPTVVNKIRNKYFVTDYMGHMMGQSQVFEIENPLLMNKKIERVTRRNESKSNTGKKTLIDIFEVYISTSLVIDNTLYHLHYSKNKTYISKIKDNQLEPIFSFNQNAGSILQQQFDTDSQFLISKKYMSNDFCFMEINNTNISLRYFINDYK